MKSTKDNKAQESKVLKILFSNEWEQRNQQYKQKLESYKKQYQQK